MVGWHHRLRGHESEQTLGDGGGQGSLVCCSPRGSLGGHDWVTGQPQPEFTTCILIGKRQTHRGERGGEAIRDAGAGVMQVATEAGRSTEWILHRPSGEPATLPTPWFQNTDSRIVKE